MRARCCRYNKQYPQANENRFLHYKYTYDFIHINKAAHAVKSKNRKLLVMRVDVGFYYIQSRALEFDTINTTED